MAKKIADESLFLTIIKIAVNSSLRKAGIDHIKTIFYDFFFLQYKAVLFPKRIPISSVDHPLDRKIPFLPRWVNIYLNFIPFWIRIIGFFLKTYKKNAIKPATEFIEAMSRIYKMATEIYSVNLSTTNRPRYLIHPRFILIHATDPHLMCIPSLHVMVVIRAYTKFRDIIRSFEGKETFSLQIDEIKKGALDIIESILYIKQHSINCVAASMYAMGKFDPPLFPFEEAKDFVSKLFSKPEFSIEDSILIKNYIMELYTKFLKEGEKTDIWEKPILDFLADLQKK